MSGTELVTIDRGTTRRGIEAELRANAVYERIVAR
jgi:hypothetical protein